MPGTVPCCSGGRTQGKLIPFQNVQYENENANSRIIAVQRMTMKKDPNQLLLEGKASGLVDQYVILGKVTLRRGPAALGKREKEYF